jgi:hypothetical protein
LISSRSPLQCPKLHERLACLSGAPMSSNARNHLSFWKSQKNRCTYLLIKSRVLSVLGGLLWVLAASLGPENSSALAQNADDKPPDQQSTERNSAKEAQTVTEFAEAQLLLHGPAGNPECVWLGRRVVSLLWRDDMDTAFRHLDLYDRFGCPARHIQAAFGCLVLNGNIDPKNADSLNGRVHACWVNPSLLATPTLPAVPSGVTH